MSETRIGLLGFGTVGSAVHRLLGEHESRLQVGNRAVAEGEVPGNHGGRVYDAAVTIRLQPSTARIGRSPDGVSWLAGWCGGVSM